MENAPEYSLVIWDRNRRKIRVDMTAIREHAGMVLILLAEHLPFAFIGNLSWLDITDDRDYQQMLEMTELYRKISM